MKSFKIDETVIKNGTQVVELGYSLELNGKTVAIFQGQGQPLNRELADRVKRLLNEQQNKKS